LSFQQSRACSGKWAVAPGVVGAEKGGGVGAREFVADRSDLGAAFFRGGGCVKSITDEALDFGVRSELLSDKLET